MKIKVYKQSLNESHILYVNDKKRNYVLADTKETSYDADRFIFKICDMVSNWPNELNNEKACDGLEFRISIKTASEEKTYLFKNKFPEDIFMLEDLIEEVLGEVKNVG